MVLRLIPSNAGFESDDGYASTGSSGSAEELVGSRGSGNDGGYESANSQQRDGCHRESQATSDHHTQLAHSQKPGFECSGCDLHFGSLKLLEQHFRESPVHAPSYYCSPCGRHFAGQAALDDHLRHSYKPRFEGAGCDLSFGSLQLLEQHFKDSPVHVPRYYCSLCGRYFAGQADSDDNTRDSPANAAPFEFGWHNRAFRSDKDLGQRKRDLHSDNRAFACDMCNRTFRRMRDLKQHKRDSPHKPEFDCSQCDRRFRSVAALEKHYQNASVHARTCVYCSRHFVDTHVRDQQLRDKEIALSMI